MATKQEMEIQDLGHGLASRHGARPEWDWRMLCALLFVVIDEQQRQVDDLRARVEKLERGE